MAKMRNGRIFLIKEASINWIKIVPATEPRKIISKINQTSENLTALLRKKYKLAENEPPQAWSLFVPRAAAGGMPVINKAGIVINPPPPAIASIKPAMNATANKMAKISTPNSRCYSNHSLRFGELNTC